MNINEIRDFILKNQEVKTISEWSKLLKVKSYQVRNAINKEIKPYIQYERSRNTYKFNYQDIFNKMKGQTQTYAQWAKDLNMEESQIRSFVAKNPELKEFIIKKNDKKYQEILNKLDHNFTLTKYEQDFLVRKNPQYSKKKKKNAQLAQRKAKIIENPKAKTLTQWSIDFDIDISSMSRFVKKNNLKDYLK